MGLEGISADPLDHISGGVIWTALCIDYPGHSFSDVSIYYGATRGSNFNSGVVLS